MYKFLIITLTTYLLNCYDLISFFKLWEMQTGSSRTIKLQWNFWYLINFSECIWKHDKQTVKQYFHGVLSLLQQENVKIAQLTMKDLWLCFSYNIFHCFPVGALQDGWRKISRWYKYAYLIDFASCLFSMHAYMLEANRHT